MGARGPSPTPTAILNLRGSWRGKINSAEPKPEAGHPPRPTLKKAEKEIWVRLLDLIESMGLLSVVDGSQLERYCVYFVRWRACEKFIAKKGISYQLKRDLESRHIDYPQVRESHRLDVALKQIEANFGLTPSARARLVAQTEEAPENSKTRFFRNT